jgi:cytoskeletal protein CcmA (bactofilin family)
VRGHLLIHGTGSVSGTVRYGRLEIQPGGVINGDVKTLQDVKSLQGAKRPAQPAPTSVAAEAKPAEGIREAS